MSPSSASLTLMRQSLSRRSANALVKRGRHVLDQHDRGREIGRQLRQYALQGNRAAGGGADGNQLVGFAFRRWRRRCVRRCTSRDRCRTYRRAAAITADAGRRRCRGWRGDRCRRAVSADTTVTARDAENLLAQQLLDLLGIARDVFEILRQEIHRAGVQRIQGDPGAFVRQRGEHQHRGRAALHDVPHCRDAIHHRHLVVHGDHVRLEGQRLIDRLFSVGRRTDDLDIRIR